MAIIGAIIGATTRAIEEEYWTYQYRTGVAGRGRSFWPDDGNGQFVDEEDAMAAGRRSGYKEIRILHITRRVEYGPTVVIGEEGGE